MADSLNLERLVLPVVVDATGYHKGLYKVQQSLERFAARSDKIGRQIALSFAKPMESVGRVMERSLTRSLSRSVSSVRRATHEVGRTATASFGIINRSVSRSTSLMQSMENATRREIQAMRDLSREMSRQQQVNMRRGVAGATGAVGTPRGMGRAGEIGLGLGLSAGALLPVSAAIASVAREASAFESSFTGVRKTVNATEPELQALSRQFRDMALQIPVNVNEINAIGEAAGQLGIKTENMAGFVRVMADLGVTTNLSSQEAATQLARMAAITSMAQTDFDRLGSAIVGLGNNFETTEAEIVSMAMRIAGAGTQIGLTESDILATAAALSSVGIEAEAGGSAISKILIDMAAAVSNGGDSLKQFSDVAAMVGVDFASTFKTDAAGALDAFIRGLNQIKKEGGDVIGTLTDMGIEEIRMRTAILNLAGAGDKLTKTLATGREEWAANNALANEAALRYSTGASKMQILKNQVTEIAITLGTALSPALSATVEMMKNAAPYIQAAAEWFAKLPLPIRMTVGVLAMLTAALPPILLTLAGLPFIVQGATIAWTGFNAVMVTTKGLAIALASPFQVLIPNAIAYTLLGFDGLKSAMSWIMVQGIPSLLANLPLVAAGFAGLAGAAIGIWLLVRAHQELNRQIERGKELSGELDKLQQKQTTNIMRTAENIDNEKERVEYLRQQLKLAENGVKAAKEIEAMQRGRQKQLEESKILGLNITGEKQAAVDAAVAEARAARQSAEDRAAQIESTLYSTEMSIKQQDKARIASIEMQRQAAQVAAAVVPEAAPVSAPVSAPLAQVPMTSIPYAGAAAPQTGTVPPAAVMQQFNPQQFAGGMVNPLRRRAKSLVDVNVADYAPRAQRYASPLRRKAKSLLDINVGDYAPRRGSGGGYTPIPQPVTVASATPVPVQSPASAQQADGKTNKDYLAQIADNTSVLKKQTVTLVPANLRS